MKNEKVEKILISVFPVLKKKIDPDWGPEEVEGWDSLAHLNLVMEINKEFGINLEFDEVMTIEKISDIYRILLDKKIPL
jgi:acyl carrier protein